VNLEDPDIFVLVEVFKVSIFFPFRPSIGRGGSFARDLPSRTCAASV
jgi:hypothetical protein